MTYLFLLLFLAVMTAIYFLPYRKLRGKIFTKLLFNPPATLTYIRFKDKTFTVVLERNAKSGLWNVISPAYWKANDNKVQRLAVKLSELDVFDRYTNAADDSVYEVGKHGELHLSYGRKEYTVLIGKKVDATISSLKNSEGSSPDEISENIYVNKSNDKDVLIVSASLLMLLPKNADEFKDLMLFNAYYSDVTSVEAMFSGNTLLLTKVDNGWIKKGKMVFEHDARPFIESVLALEAVKIAPHGTKIPPKPDGFVIVKISGQPVTRYFFPIENDANNFLMPVSGESLIVPKSIVDTILNF